MATEAAISKGSAPLPTTAQTHLRGLIEQVGLAPLAKALNVSRESLARAAGGLDVRFGTRVVILAGLSLPECAVAEAK